MIVSEVAILNINHNIQVTGEHLELLARTLPGFQFVVVDKTDDLKTRCMNADVLIAWPFVDNAMISYCLQAPNLRYIHLFTSGVDSLINSEIGRIAGLTVTSTKGIHGYPISDHTLALIYSFLRQLPACYESQHNHAWKHGSIAVHCREIAGLTAGIIGVGNIGLEIARKCKLLGMRVLGAKRTPISSEWLDECYSIKELDLLLMQADFVVLAMPLTDESRHMIDRQRLSVMKKSAVLINIARGGVVNPDDLTEALLDGTIAGAALDVTEPEPLPAGSPLWDMPNVIITPHIAAQSPQYMDRAINIAIENVRRYAAGENLLFEYTLQTID